MKCAKCGNEFPDNELQLSHDVPRYVFMGDKNLADKHGRHWLCKKCHDIYEKMVFAIMIKSLPLEDRETLCRIAEAFAKRYFNG